MVLQVLLQLELLSSEHLQALFFLAHQMEHLDALGIDHLNKRLILRCLHHYTRPCLRCFHTCPVQNVEPLTILILQQLPIRIAFLVFQEGLLNYLRFRNEGLIRDAFVQLEHRYFNYDALHVDTLSW